MARARIRRHTVHILWIAILALSLPATAVGQTEDAAQLREQASALYRAAKYGEALAAKERLVQLTEQNKENKAALATDFSNLAWYALFARQPEKALAASERALKLAPYDLAIETNRAHALLFLGRTGEARAIYLSHKGEQIGKQGKWEVAIVQDFKEFRARGLGDPAMAAIEEGLATAADSV